MSEQQKQNNKWDKLALLVVFIWPFVFLYRYIIADASFSLKLRMDVIHFYYSKVYLLDTLSNFRIPLWSPGEGCGFPFFSSPFNQAFYPLHYPLAIYYKLSGGFSWVDYQRFSILGLGLFAVFLYLWLRNLRINWRAALIATLVMSISFKMTGIINRMQATHSIAWIMMILWGMTYMLRKGQLVKGGIIVSIGTFLLLTSAYPYYIYYSAFLLPPIFLAYMIKPIREQLTGISDLNIGKYIGTLATAFALPGIICAPYLYSLIQLPKLVGERNTLDFAKATSSNYLETIGSLIFPPFSNDKGWYYFGFIALSLIIVYLISRIIPLIKTERKPLIPALLVSFMVLISFITYGKSFVFAICTKIIPAFSSFATWGRLNIILVPLIAYLLAQAYTHLENIILYPEKRVDNFNKNLGIIVAILAAIHASIFFVQRFLLNNYEFNFAWVRRYLPQFKEGNEPFYLTMGIVSFLLVSFMLVVLPRIIKSDPLKSSIKIVLPVLILAISAYDIGIVSPKLRSVPRTAPSKKAIIDVESINANAFEVDRNWRTRLSGIYSDNQFSVLHTKRWYYQSYKDFLKDNGAIGKWEPVKHGLKMEKERPEIVDQILGVKDGKRIFFTNKINYNLTDFIENSQVHETSSNFEYEVITYNGDYLEVKVISDKAGYFSFIDNWDKDWKARVNGQDIPIEKLFKTFKSIPLDKGQHIIQFLYKPFLFSIFRGFPSIDMQETKSQVVENVITNPNKTITTDQEVEWMDTIGLSLNKEAILEKNNKKGWFSSGAYSKNRLNKGADGAVSISMSKDIGAISIGLSNENPNAHFKSIEYALRIDSKGNLQVFESGKKKSKSIASQFGDILKIERIDNGIYYRKNEEIFYQSDLSTDAELGIDVSLFNKGAKLKGIKSSF